MTRFIQTDVSQYSRLSKRSANSIISFWGKVRVKREMLSIHACWIMLVCLPLLQVSSIYCTPLGVKHPLVTYIPIYT